MRRYSAPWIFGLYKNIVAIDEVNPARLKFLTPLLTYRYVQITDNEEGKFMGYVDGFVVPVPKKKLAAYQKMSRKAGKIWRDHGALQYVEAAGDDLNVKFGVPFTKQMKCKPGETVVFAWIVYKSRAHRDKVNAKDHEGSAYS